MPFLTQNHPAFLQVTTYKGKTHTEFSKRVINENGFYRLVSHEGWFEMMKADGMPLDMIKQIYGKMKFHFINFGDGYKATEILGNGSETYCAKYDEEVEKPAPFPGAPPTKILVSKLGVGKYKVILKETNKGTVYDITDTYYDGGLISVSSKH